MLALLNILANERLKLKGNKLFLVCTLLAFALPIFMIAVDLSYGNTITTKISSYDWIIRLVIPIQVIIYPILSGFILTFLVQKEYGEKTIINTITAPTNRVDFLAAKYVIWCLWVITINLGFLLITFGGFYILYGSATFNSSIEVITKTIVNTGLLTFLSMSPMLAICILQRSVFYPSILMGCFVSGVSFAGLYWPEIIRNLIPWSAVTSITILNEQSILPYMSIFVFWILGLLFSIYCFKKQDL